MKPKSLHYPSNGVHIARHIVIPSVMVLWLRPRLPCNPAAVTTGQATPGAGVGPSAIVPSLTSQPLNPRVDNRDYYSSERNRGERETNNNKAFFSSLGFVLWVCLYGEPCLFHNTLADRITLK